MKILHTIYDDIGNPWCGGGGALRALKISRHLAGKHEITLLTGTYPGAIANEFQNGLRIQRIGSNRSYALSRLSFSVLASNALVKEPFDLWVYNFSAFSPLQASARLRKRCLLEFFHLLSDHATRKYPVFGHISRLAERLTLQIYPNILTISPSITKKLQEKTTNQNLHLVYTGVDQICFEAPFFEKDYILYFGRLDTYNKGIDLLLKAFAKIQTNYPDIRLVLAGRSIPKKQREVESLSAALGLSNRVEFKGSVSEEEKVTLYGSTLFTCMPSRFEGWGIAALEAGAAGKAVIGTNIPGLVDAIRPNETGILVPTENIDALANAMCKLLENPDYRRRLGMAGRKWAESFTWDRVALEQERVYEKIHKNTHSYD